MAERAKRPVRKAARHTRRSPANKATTTTRASSDAVIEGADNLVEALDSEIRLRVSTAMLVAGLIVVVLLVLTAAASVNWLYAIVTIALAFVAGWIACRATS